MEAGAGVTGGRRGQEYGGGGGCSNNRMGAGAPRGGWQSGEDGPQTPAPPSLLRGAWKAEQEGGSEAFWRHLGVWVIWGRGSLGVRVTWGHVLGARGSSGLGVEVGLVLSGRLPRSLPLCPLQVGCLPWAWSSSPNRSLVTVLTPGGRNAVLPAAPCESAPHALLCGLVGTLPLAIFLRVSSLPKMILLFVLTASYILVLELSGYTRASG